MRSSGIGNWGDETMAPSLRLLPPKQKKVPQERRVRKISDSEATRRPFLSAHADVVIRGAEKGEMHYCPPPLLPSGACEHLLKTLFIL